MPHFGGQNAKKKSSSITKRNFTVVIGSKEHGLYVSSSPSSAARKAVSKLCATDKKRKVSFHIRETTQKSEKKTYGPYLGYIEKLAKPIELKGRVIRYKPVAKLSGKTGKKSVIKKGGMRGGGGNKVMVLKIKIPDNDFNKLEKDLDFLDVLESINPRGNYMTRVLDKDTNGISKFLGLCVAAQRSESDFNDNIVPITEKSEKFGIRLLQFLLFKHGYHDSSFSIFISRNTIPYVPIDPEQEKKYLPLTDADLTNSEKRNMATPNDPNSNDPNYPRPKPMGFPDTVMRLDYNSPGFANRLLGEKENNKNE
jgi:hypothetical protein